ncbi:MAG TPA: hypothetical protein VF062_05940 [Candidatus Limnocylindrales bacterium]
MTTDPASVLVFPKPDERMEAVNNTVGFTQYLSISYWLGELADKLLKQNPWEEASRMIAGDWKMVSVTGVAVGHLAEFNVAFAQALNEENRKLFTQRDWTGKAATDAANYFRNLELTLGGQVDPLQDMATQIKALALAVNQAADRIKGLLEELTDELITFGVGGYVKAGVAFVRTGTTAAASARRAGDLCREIVKEWDRVVNAVKGYGSLILGGLAQMALQRKQFKAMTPAGYDHLGVHPPRTP